MVVEPYSCRPVQHSTTCLQEPRKEYPPTRGLGSGLVSLVPYLGDALSVVGNYKKYIDLSPAVYQGYNKSLLAVVREWALDKLFLKGLLAQVDRIVQHILVKNIILRKAFR